MTEALTEHDFTSKKEGFDLVKVGEICKCFTFYVKSFFFLSKKTFQIKVENVIETLSLH